MYIGAGFVYFTISERNLSGLNIIRMTYMNNFMSLDTVFINIFTETYVGY